MICFPNSSRDSLSAVVMPPVPSSDNPGYSTFQQDTNISLLCSCLLFLLETWKPHWLDGNLRGMQEEKINCLTINMSNPMRFNKCLKTKARILCFDLLTIRWALEMIGQVTCVCVLWGREVDFNTKFEKSSMTMQRSRDVGELNFHGTGMVLFLA